MAAGRFSGKPRSRHPPTASRHRQRPPPAARTTDAAWHLPAPLWDPGYPTPAPAHCPPPPPALPQPPGAKRSSLRASARSARAWPALRALPPWVPGLARSLSKSGGRPADGLAPAARTPGDRGGHPRGPSPRLRLRGFRIWCLQNVGAAPHPRAPPPPRLPHRDPGCTNPQTPRYRYGPLLRLHLGASRPKSATGLRSYSHRSGYIPRVISYAIDHSQGLA